MVVQTRVVLETGGPPLLPYISLWPTPSTPGTGSLLIFFCFGALFFYPPNVFSTWAHFNKQHSPTAPASFVHHGSANRGGLMSPSRPIVLDPALKHGVNRVLGDLQGPAVLGACRLWDLGGNFPLN